MNAKANFITSCIFDKPLKVVKLDKAAIDYHMRLNHFLFSISCHRCQLQSGFGCH